MFDAAWREAYQGIIPGPRLAQDDRATRPALVALGHQPRTPARRARCREAIAGYASYGRCRDRSLAAEGEIDELYLAPEYQGLGFGARLFKAVRNDLRDRGPAHRRLGADRQ